MKKASSFSKSFVDYAYVFKMATFVLFYGFCLHYSQGIFAYGDEIGKTTGADKSVQSTGVGVKGQDSENMTKEAEGTGDSVKESDVEEEPISPLHHIIAETELGETRWKLELASTDAERASGLMYRKDMPMDTGMLFRFNDSQPIFMWMKNTYITLDMVFMNVAGKITHIHRSALPLSENIITSRGPARFVLELNAGQANKAGLKIGQHLRHPWFLVEN